MKLDQKYDQRNKNDFRDYRDRLFENNDDYEINLIFNNNANITLKAETLEVRLEDQNEIEK